MYNFFKQVNPEPFNNSLFRPVNMWLKPNEVKTLGRYLFESTGGDPISREHDVTEKDGELGVYLEATRRFIKVKDFRKDCRLKLIKLISV